VDDGAIALLGPAAAGKSTTAAALARLGLPILADDIAALEAEGQRIFVRPGYPRLNLWPPAVQAIFGAPDALPLITPNWAKRYLSLEQPGYRFAARSQPLRAIYLLGTRCADSRAPYAEPVPAREAMVELVSNTYLNCLPDAELRAREFEFLGRLQAWIPVRRVFPHTDPGRLTSLCETILDDFRQLTHSIRQTRVGMS